jgi:hypothetical protein
MRYIAEIPNVCEVILFGLADLSYWQDRLALYDLQPVPNNGKAEITISATELKWMGVKFNELTVSIASGRGEDGHSQDEAYLIHAYNSVRVLALTERQIFRTPYYYGDLRVEARVPASMQLNKGGAIALYAAMSGEGVRLRKEYQAWEGPVFLPSSKKNHKQAGELFYVKLVGETEVYPFAAADRLELIPDKVDGVLRWLVDSNFAGHEWRIRANATHSRSKTYPSTRQDP